MFESVKIFHHWHHNDEYLFWKDFFELVGLYVSEFSSEFDNTNSNYSTILVLKNGISDEQVGSLKNKYPNAIILDVYSDFANLNKYFQKGLKIIKESCYELTNDDYETLQKIGDIYIKNNMTYHINSCKSIIVTNKQNAYKLAENSYINALKEIMKLSKMNSFYILYAKSNLKYLVNFAHYHSCYSEFFPCIDIEENIKELKTLINLFPSFSKSYLLLAKEYKAINNQQARKMSLIYSQMLLENIYSKPYDQAFYDMAKIYSNAKRKDEMRKMYFKANVANNFSIKYNYKYGVELKKEDSVLALPRFEKVFSLLYNKYINHYLLPEEEIYFIRSIIAMRNIYGDYLWDLENWKKSKILLDETLDYLEQEESTIAGREIFGEDTYVLQKNLRKDLEYIKNRV